MQATFSPALTLFPKGFGVLTTEFKMNLLNPGRGERLVASGRVVKSGRTLTVAASDVYGESGDGSRMTDARARTGA